MREGARKLDFEWRKTHKEQSQVLTHWPGDQDEQGDHSSGNLDGGSYCDSDRYLHLSKQD